MTGRLQTLKGLVLYLKSFGGILDLTIPLTQAFSKENHVKMDSFEVINHHLNHYESYYLPLSCIE